MVWEVLGEDREGEMRRLRDETGRVRKGERGKRGDGKIGRERERA